MEAKDTVVSSGILCRQVCHKHREATLEAKNCDGLDCEECQLGKQAEISFKAGYEEGRLYGKQESLLNQAIIGQLAKDERREGRVEVLEWVVDNVIGFEPTLALLDSWHKKLKEWEEE